MLIKLLNSDTPLKSSYDLLQTNWCNQVFLVQFSQVTPVQDALSVQ